MKEFYQRFQHIIPVATFLGGFLFDVATLGRVDTWTNILSQFLYLSLIGTYLVFESFHTIQEVRPHKKAFTHLWNYRQFIIHFCFGGLLNAYALFFYKSASFSSSFIFLMLMVILVLANEFPQFQRQGPILKWGLWSLCLTSFFTILIPIVLGSLAMWHFFLSLALSLGVQWKIYRKVELKMHQSLVLRKQILVPGIIVQVAFLLLFMFQWIPPVPLSVEYLGIYHHIEKVEDHYELTHNRPWWRFWHHGDQIFLARPTDRIFCFARIFSPAKFKDTVYFRWDFHDPRLGWQKTDRIPVKITGGRDEGFRGFTFKDHYQAGQWRILVESEDGREIGRLRFDVQPVQEGYELPVRKELH